MKTLKPEEKPYEVMDALVRGFGMRIMPSGVKSFISSAVFQARKILHGARLGLTLNELG